MLKNIYTPLAGAIAQERALEALSNNLANINTVGYKSDSVTFSLQDPEPYKNYPDPIPPANYKVDLDKIGPLKGNEISYVGIAGIKRDHTQGPAITTYNKLDLMIEGEGFFNVQTREGRRYQRAGDLTLNREGVLVTKQGDPVLGEKGLIYLKSEQFQINSAGNILQDGALVDTIKMSNFRNPENLEKVGMNYFLHKGHDESEVIPFEGSLRQGFLEGSNVNSIKNLSNLIVSHRSYEAYQKAVSNYDKIMDKTSNSIGEVRA